MDQTIALPVDRTWSYRRLTQVQRRALCAANVHRIGRLVGCHPRTIEVLVARGWVELDGYHYGPLFRISDAGRAAVALASEASR